MEVTNEHLRSDDFMNFKSRCAARRGSEGLGLCDIHQRWCLTFPGLSDGCYGLRAAGGFRLWLHIRLSCVPGSLIGPNAPLPKRILDLSNGERLLREDVVISRYSNVLR